MIDYIKSEFKKAILKRIKKSASQEVLSEERVQVLLGLDKDGENTYFMCKDFVPNKQVDFLHLLDVKVDFMQKSQFVPPFIKKSLLNLEKENSFKPNSACVLISKRTDGSLRMCLYEFTVYKKDVKLEDFFQTEEM